MKSTLKIIIYPATGLIIFVLALCIILAMKGKLNADTFARLPLVGKPEATREEKPAPPVQTVTTMRYFSSEEISDMLKETRALMLKNKEEEKMLLEREKRLDMVKQELALEKRAIRNMQTALDSKFEEMKKNEAALGDRVTEITQLELAGAQRSATIYEAMDSKKAASALTLLDKPQVAKLLSLMDEKKAAKIVGEMTPQAAAEVMSALKQVKATVEKKE